MPVETPAATPALKIAKFDKALHNRSAFSCGHGPIDNFLKSSLSDQIKAGMVAAYMATKEGDPAVLGFYTLGALAFRADLGPKSWQRARVPDVPVIYLRAVAVRRDQQGRGLGTALVIDALYRCLGIADQIGAAAVVLDVLEDDHFERRWGFYESLGFKALGDPENSTRVFVPMADVQASLGRGGKAVPQWDCLVIRTGPLRQSEAAVRERPILAGNQLGTPPGPQPRGRVK